MASQKEDYYELLGVARDELRQSDFMFIDERGFVPGISTAGSDWIFPA